MFDFGGGEVRAREIERPADVKALAGEEHRREEPRLAPHVERDAGVDERDERIEALVLGLAEPRGVVDVRGAVGAKLQRRGDPRQVALHGVAVDVRGEIALDEEPLAQYVWCEIAHDDPPRPGPRPRPLLAL